VVILANGLAENRALTRGDRRLRPFQVALDALTQRLAVMLVKDGEGASLVIDVRVRGAKTRSDASWRRAPSRTRTCSRRPWPGATRTGVASCRRSGAAGVAVQEDRIGIWYGEEQVAAGGRLRDGRALGPGEGGAGQARGRDHGRLGLGSAQDHIWTCDFTTDYVKINTGTS
jgi:glutamate N-acetyltransferase/amino-acid N-acetyltransferase